MVIDSSALIAILEAEQEAELFAETIKMDSIRLISAFSVVETTIVIESRRGEEGVKELGLLLQKATVEIISVTAEHAATACEAYHNYGKGRHPAKLNFGDCFSYAAAKLNSEPLLFKGYDFSKTDIRCCIE